jgi:hypothetical protein
MADTQDQRVGIGPAGPSLKVKGPRLPGGGEFHARLPAFEKEGDAIAAQVTLHHGEQERKRRKSPCRYDIGCGRRRPLEPLRANIRREPEFAARGTQEGDLPRIGFDHGQSVLEAGGSPRDGEGNGGEPSP